MKTRLKGRYRNEEFACNSGTGSEGTVGAWHHLVVSLQWWFHYEWMYVIRPYSVRGVYWRGTS